MVGPNDGWNDSERQTQPRSVIDNGHVGEGLTKAAEYLDVSTDPISVIDPDVEKTIPYPPGYEDKIAGAQKPVTDLSDPSDAGTWGQPQYGPGYNAEKGEL